MTSPKNEEVEVRRRRLWSASIIHRPDLVWSGGQSKRLPEHRHTQTAATATYAQARLHLHAAKLGPPTVESCITEAVLTTQLLHRYSALRLAEKPLFHARSPFGKRTLLRSRWHCLRGARQRHRSSVHAKRLAVHARNSLAPSRSLSFQFPQASTSVIRDHTPSCVPVTLIRIRSVATGSNQTARFAKRLPVTVAIAVQLVPFQLCTSKSRIP